MFVLSVAISFFFFFFNDTATTEIYTLSLHDALPISSDLPVLRNFTRVGYRELLRAGVRISSRSEEHTSELQSLTNLVCRLLLEKKKKRKIENHINNQHSKIKSTKYYVRYRADQRVHN